MEAETAKNCKISQSSCSASRKICILSAIFGGPKYIKFAFKLAREAIVAQVNMPAESSGGRNLYETCVICFEDNSTDQIFSVDGCMHRYCYSCMKQHIEVKMLHGMAPKCPHETCDSELKIDSRSKLLTPKFVERMKKKKWVLKEKKKKISEKKKKWVLKEEVGFERRSGFRRRRRRFQRRRRRYKRRRRRRRRRRKR